MAGPLLRWPSRDTAVTALERGGAPGAKKPPGFDASSRGLGSSLALSSGHGAVAADQGGDRYRTEAQQFVVVSALSKGMGQLCLPATCRDLFGLLDSGRPCGTGCKIALLLEERVPSSRARWCSIQLTASQEHIYYLGRKGICF